MEMFTTQQTGNIHLVVDICIDASTNVFNANTTQPRTYSWRLMFEDIRRALIQILHSIPFFLSSIGMI